MDVGATTRHWASQLAAQFGHDGATRNARRSLDEWARAEVEVTALVERIPPAAGMSPGPATAPPLAASAGRGR
jgi:hypothetical protein